MALSLDDTAPDFDAETTDGKVRFHDWIGNNWWCYCLAVSCSGSMTRSTSSKLRPVVIG